MSITWKVQVDWDNDGSFATVGDDITAYVLSVQGSGGFWDDDPTKHVARTGTMTVTVNNNSRMFSPAYAAGPLYGKLLPRRPIRLQVTYSGTTKTMWRGFIQRIAPEPGQSGTRRCTIECVDFLGIAAKVNLDLPLRIGKTADNLIRAIFNYALGAPVASGTVTIPDYDGYYGATLTVDGVKLNLVRGDTPLAGTTNDVLFGADVHVGVNPDLAGNIAAAINHADGSGTIYSASTDPFDNVKAVGTTKLLLTISAIIRGAEGNSITLSRTAGHNGTTLTLSGATLSGGADYPAGLISSDTGLSTFPYAGDKWSGENTNAITALQQILASDLGWLFVQRDGTITYKNRDLLTKLGTLTAPVMTMTSISQAYPAGEVNESQVHNRIMVKNIQRNVAAQGVVAQSAVPILVPGNSGTVRWNPTTGLPTNANVVVRLPFIDPTTNQPCGARSLVTPLVASTDFTVNDQSDGSGNDLTSNGKITFSLATNGSVVEISISNSSGSQAWVTMLKVRGISITTYNPSTTIVEDATSQATYNVQTLVHELPLSGDTNLAAALASYELNKYKNPTFRFTVIDFQNLEVVAGVNVFSLNLGDAVSITEYQSGVSGGKHALLGYKFMFQPGNVHQLSFFGYRLDETTYKIYDDATYGVYDSAGTQYAL